MQLRSKQYSRVYRALYSQHTYIHSWDLLRRGEAINSEGCPAWVGTRGLHMQSRSVASPYLPLHKHAIYRYLTPYQIQYEGYSFEYTVMTLHTYVCMYLLPTTRSPQGCRGYISDGSQIPVCIIRYVQSMYRVYGKYKSTYTNAMYFCGKYLQSSTCNTHRCVYTEYVQ